MGLKSRPDLKEKVIRVNWVEDLQVIFMFIIAFYFSNYIQYICITLHNLKIMLSFFFLT